MPNKLIIALSLLMAAFSAHGAIYKIVDANGHVTFTNHPTPKGERVNLDGYNLDPKPAPAPAKPPAAKKPDEPPKTLEVYGRPTCGHCLDLRRDLEERGIAYSYYDIDQDDDAASRYKSIGGNGSVPLTRYGKSKMRGYSASSLAVFIKTLGLK